MPIANENSNVPSPVSRDNFNVYVTQPIPEPARWDRPMTSSEIVGSTTTNFNRGRVFRPDAVTTTHSAGVLSAPVGSAMANTTDSLGSPTTSEILREIDRVSEGISAANRVSTNAFIVNADAFNGTVNLNSRAGAVQIYVAKSGDKFEVKALGKTIIAEAPAEIPQAVFRLLEGSKLFD